MNGLRDKAGALGCQSTSSLLPKMAQESEGVCLTHNDWVFWSDVITIMTYYRHHNTLERGACLTLMEFWFPEPGAEEEVYQKVLENVKEHHIKKAFMCVFCLKLILHSQEEDRKCGGRESRMTCAIGPQLLVHVIDTGDV